MKISVDIDRDKRNETLEVEQGATVKDLCEKLNINPEEFIVSRKGELVLVDEDLIDGDELHFISVISGG